ncbi:zinc-binding alcohol dehydrogenase family protein [Halalkalibacter okhensis]|nr:zinc-binding alcohol dehydrogenase family protein [Halalkalibacter okhensis]
MKAVGLYQYLSISEQESLIDLEVEKPTATGSDVLVKVQAISVNPVDTKVRKPKDKIEETAKILGWDVAGVVEEVGPDCTLFQKGDEVYYAGTITRPGGNSEYHLVDERIVGHKPKSINFAEAAAMPLTALTAYEGLFVRLGVSKEDNSGKSILLIGAAGGVGSIAIQLAKWAGLTVIGTASRPESSKLVQDRGADAVINHHQPFLPQLKEAGFEEVDYIFCLNHTDQHWDHMAEAIKPQGKICSIFETNKPLNLYPLFQKSATFVWEFMFTRSRFETPDMIEQHHILNEMANLIDSKTIETTVNQVMSPINAENIRKAHAELEAGTAIGKIVLEHFC